MYRQAVSSREIYFAMHCKTRGDSPWIYTRECEYNSWPTCIRRELIRKEDAAVLRFLDAPQDLAFFGIYWISLSVARSTRMKDAFPWPPSFIHALLMRISMFPKLHNRNPTILCYSWIIWKHYKNIVWLINNYLYDCFTISRQWGFFKKVINVLSRCSCCMTYFTETR